jgi:hypothetical protein
MILAYSACKHHPNEICRKHGLAVSPGCERAHPKQAEKQELGLQFRGPASVHPEEARREPGQDDKDRRADAEETIVFIVNGAKIKPSATTVPRSVMKHAASTVLPYSVVLNPNSIITA